MNWFTDATTSPRLVIRGVEIELEMPRASLPPRFQEQGINPLSRWGAR